MEEFHDLYDRIAKRCLTLSNRAVILMINGLYHTDYPTDSTLTYQWTEHEGEDLRRTLADTIIMVDHIHSYHMEFQMTRDGPIVLRIFEYGFYHAIKHQKDSNILEFPEPILICLYENSRTADTESMLIRFGTQGEFEYRVPVMKYLDFSAEELNQRHLVVLLPFQLLKLKKSIEKKRTKTNLEALKALITHDIINTIRMNVEAGNLTLTDARKLKRMILQLYHHIYDRYGELEEEGVNQIVEEALILDIDIIEKEHRDAMKALEMEKDKEKKALQLLLKGTSLEEVSIATGLSQEYIKKLSE